MSAAVVSPEAAVVYCGLLIPSQIASVDLSPEEFSDRVLRDVWRTQRELCLDGDVSRALLRERLGSAAIEAMECRIEWARQGGVRARHIADYARLVRQDAQRRAIGAVAVRLAAAATDDEINPMEASAEAIGSLGRISTAGKPPGKTLAEIAMDFNRLVSLQAIGSEEIRIAVPTGFHDLDSNLPAGGLPRECQSIVGAPTSAGKSSLLNAISVNASLLGHAVDFYTFEDTPMALAVRHLARLSRCNNKRLQSLEVPLEDRPAVDEAIETAKRLDVVVYQTTRQIGELRHEMVHNAMRRNTSLIIVDYIQKLVDSRRSENRNQELGAVSQALFDVAVKTGAALLVASQLKRIGSEAPTLGDLRDSGNIEQDSHVVMLLWRKENSDVTDVHIAKNKNGPTGHIPLRFVATSSTFRDCTPAEKGRHASEYRRLAVHAA